MSNHFPQQTLFGWEMLNIDDLPSAECRYELDHNAVDIDEAFAPCDDDLREWCDEGDAEGHRPEEQGREGRLRLGVCRRVKPPS